MKVAVLGYGTVGKGVFEMLTEARGLEQGPVLVRQGKIREIFQTDSMERILMDGSIGAVVETMGGEEPAFSYVSAALRAGKHVVTANKALVAAHGLELARLARENGAAFLFSAACGGGVPFLHNLSLATQSDRVLTLGGILNGTTNYMLDAMQRRDLTYAQALADAQELGYAEADPTADVSGLDALRKIMLACAVAFDRLPGEGLLHEGIEAFTAEDAADLKARGLVCRLVGRGGMAGERVYAFVEPTLFPEGAAERSVLDNYNLARYEAKCAGPIVLMGQGAGRYPTASAVLRDLSDVLQGKRAMLSPTCQSARADNSGCGHRYYVRIPAALAREFPGADAAESGGIVRLVTQPMTVLEMHEKAAALRQAGAELFFAGIEEA
ncbi:MAG: homoserine dehydrogenase [Clostridia bacterium]|nr:homoserine dehydrogenase [Clostridia bacterium]MDY2929200.1 homoserine dehydrogenase [Clostridiaceae bacterium]